MNMLGKILFVTLFICIASLEVVSAQTPQPSPTLVKKGVINGVAIALPKPVYPESARQAKLGGAVKVEVKIDEAGKVTSATAVSGDEAFRAAAEQAALKALFKPTFLSGKPVKVSGFIVYNFVAEKKEDEPYWILGMLVSILKTEPQLWKVMFSEEDLKEMQGGFKDTDFPPELEEQKKLLVKLSNAAEEERQQIAVELDESLEKQLTGDNAWQYKVGENLGIVFIEIAKSKGFGGGDHRINEALLKSNLQKIKDLSASASPEISADFLAILKQIVVFADEPDIIAPEKLDDLFQKIQLVFTLVPDE